jgi:hypothetical protein
MSREVYLYSPFCPSTVSRTGNPALLLQFILFEIARAGDNLTDGPTNSFPPFDWSKGSSPLTRLQEHTTLLKLAFPDLATEAEQFEKSLKGRSVEQLFTSLRPFIASCKKDENLLLFLLKHQSCFEIKSLLFSYFPHGAEQVEQYLIDCFEKRGLSSFIPDIKRLCHALN